MDFEIMKKWIAYGLIGMLALACGCSASTENDRNIPADTETEMTSWTPREELYKVEEAQFILTGNSDKREIITKSEYDTSYREMVGFDKEVVYLGLPRCLEECGEEYVWTTSDDGIATVERGTVTGYREGTVWISKLNEKKELIKSWELVVTTFNDGKQAEACYEIGPEGFGNAEVEYYYTVKPEYLKDKINTIQDAISYFQNSWFTIDFDAPIMATDKSCWLWCQSGADVLQAKRGGTAEMAAAAGYLLGDNFEQSGYIYTLGVFQNIFNWFYEDGTYYVVSFGELIQDMSEGAGQKNYVPFKTKNREEISEYLKNFYNEEETAVTFMIPSLSGTEIPPVYTSYLHNSMVLLSIHAEMGFEKAYFDEMSILYENPNLKYTLKAFEPEEIPDSVPKLQENRGSFYRYE